MAAAREFLDWEQPVPEAVRRHLLGESLDGPADLSRTFLVVPTRQAGRRLLEHLALFCADQGTALLSPRTDTPAGFLRSAPLGQPVAPPLAVSALWARLLLDRPYRELRPLFPAEPHRDFAWALQTGGLIQTLRDTLAEGGLLIADILAQHGEALAEPARWDALARLETRYLAELRRHGLLDPAAALIQQAAESSLPPGFDTLVVAATPDPPPIFLAALERIANRADVRILIHAPGSEAGHFDPWGRPDTAHWTGREIPLPHPERDLWLERDPLGQARFILQLMAEEGRNGQTDIALGVPDPEVAPLLAEALAEQGMPAFDPSGHPVGQHPLVQLLARFHAWESEDRYGTFSALFRHADVLHWLALGDGPRPEDLLRELDEFQNEHLPSRFADIQRHIVESSGPRHLKVAVKRLATLRERLTALAPADAARELLKTIYADKHISSGIPEDDAMEEVAGTINEALEALGGAEFALSGASRTERIELVLRALEAQRIFPDRDDARIDLEGWLELPWNPAATLLVAGMNEGLVPDGRIEDPFLPDSFRHRIGLRGDEDRLARDSYLLCSLLASRREKGRVVLIAGKVSAAGDPLKPSRLLFRCPDDELPRRALRLFADAQSARRNPPPTPGFPLRVPLPQPGHQPEHLNVSDFSVYLACPFRYYLGKVLGMKPLRDDAEELDALAFGSLIHDALRALHDDPALRRCEDPHALAEPLCRRAEAWVRRRIGPRPPLPVELQLESAFQRLRAAARVQAELNQNGWEIFAVERPMEWTCAGMRVKGRIDRIDRHRESGRLRLLDYKTSDQGAPPEATHLGTARADRPAYMHVQAGDRTRQWTQLQLPLYLLMARSDPDLQGPFEVGYFSLPAATRETGIAIWHAADTLSASALACAEGVVSDIRAQLFWPPASHIRHDDYERLFPQGIEAGVDPAFMAEMEARRP